MNSSSNRWLPIFFRLCCVLAGALSLAPRLDAQGSPTGTIEGRVFDPRRGEYLEKARVTIEGSSQEVLDALAADWKATFGKSGRGS